WAFLLVNHKRQARLAEERHTPQGETVPASSGLDCDQFHNLLDSLPALRYNKTRPWELNRPMFAWENLSKSYSRRRLFSGLTGQVGAGEIVAVTGPNGSGKS